MTEEIISTKNRVPGAQTIAQGAFGGDLIINPRTPKGNTKRTRAQRESDIVEIASMYLRGMPQKSIAEWISNNRPYTLSPVMISYDLKIVRSRWLESAMVDFNAAKSKELAKLDELERTYWTAWEDSKKKRELNVVETIEDATGEKKTHSYSRTKGKRATESRDGNVNFLLGVERCIAKRCAILGLDAPKVVDINWRSEAEKLGADPDRMLNDLVNQFVSAAEKTSIDSKVVDAEWSDASDPDKDE